MKDKFIVKPQTKSEGFKPALIDIGTHELLTQMKEMTGVPICRLIEAAVKFASERMEIEE